jgi:hypothetical protein
MFVCDSKLAPAYVMCLQAPAYVILLQFSTRRCHVTYACAFMLVKKIVLKHNQSQVAKDLIMQLEGHRKQVKKLEEMLGPHSRMLLQQVERIDQARVQHKEEKLIK